MLLSSSFVLVDVNIFACFWAAFWLLFQVLYLIWKLFNFWISGFFVGFFCTFFGAIDSVPAFSLMATTFLNVFFSLSLPPSLLASFSWPCLLFLFAVCIFNSSDHLFFLGLGMALYFINKIATSSVFMFANILLGTIFSLPHIITIAAVSSLVS